MPSARVRVRVRALVLLAVFVFAAPTALAEPPEVVPIEVPPVVTPNDVPAVIARPAAPIELVETGGGYAAAGGVKARVEPAARTFPATATEEGAARAEYSTLVANPHGTFSQTVSLGRINYQDKAGAWQPIDVSARISSRRRLRARHAGQRRRSPDRQGTRRRPHGRARGGRLPRSDPGPGPRERNGIGRC